MLLFRHDYCYMLTVMLSFNYFNPRTHMESATVCSHSVCDHIGFHVIPMFHLLSIFDNMTSI